jgi:hypothetical protein
MSAIGARGDDDMLRLVTQGGLKRGADILRYYPRRIKKRSRHAKIVSYPRRIITIYAPVIYTAPCIMF